jgi:hypothetical protein
VGKSWITSAYVLWRLYEDPQRNILVVSASKERADNFTTFCLQLIHEVPFLNHLKPRPEQRQSKVSFDVAAAEADQNPSVKSMGITGQLAGSRADEIIPDDIEVPNNSDTPMQREKLAERSKEFEAILKPGGRITYLGTPQNEASLYNQLTERGYTVRIWPVLYPTDAEQREYGPLLDPTVSATVTANPQLVGHSVEPTRFPADEVEKRRISYGRAGFALQFMLNTRLSDEDRYPLKLRDLIVTPLDATHAAEKYIWSALPEQEWKDLSYDPIGHDRLFRPVVLRDSRYMPYSGVVMAIDPSGRGKDETGYAVLAILHSQLFLLDAGGFQDGYSPDTLNAIARLAQRWGVKRIIYEANYGDGMFGSLLRPVLGNVYPCTVEEVKHSVQKEKRICDTLEPVVQSHRLIVNADLIEKDYNSTSHLAADSAFHYRLFYQFTRITRERGALVRDDRLDAVAIAVAFYTQHLALDVDKAVKRAKDAALDKELKRFVKHALGHKSPDAGRMWANRMVHTVRR